LLRLAGTAGAFVYGWPQGGRQTLMATDIWLGSPLGGGLAAARLELVRRFVHAYGPVTARHFAAWTGISPDEARERFLELGDELVDVKLDGANAVVLAADRELLADPPFAVGARLLPAGDPFLAQRDRSTLLPDKAHRRALWRPAGSPGLVLMTGRPVGIWRARQAGARLRVTVEPFGELNPRKRQAIEQAAAVVAPFRGRDDVEVTFACAGPACRGPWSARHAAWRDRADDAGGGLRRATPGARDLRVDPVPGRRAGRRRGPGDREPGRLPPPPGVRLPVAARPVPRRPRRRGRPHPRARPP